MSKFITHIATIEIPVSNLERALSFYIEILGVEVQFKGENTTMLTFKSKGIPSIFLVETEANDRLSFRNSHSNVFHSVIDFYTPNLSEMYDWLKGKKVKVGSLNINELNGLGGFGFQDPDGNWLGACNIPQSGK